MGEFSYFKALNDPGWVLCYEQKKIKGAEAVGVKVKVSKGLDKISEKVLFPQKMKIANKLLLR